MTEQGSAVQNLPAEARAEAAAWIARLHGPQRSPALEAGFHRWLQSDPQNARAFEGMTEIWDAVAGTHAGRFPRLNGPRTNTPATGSATRRRFAVAAALVLAVAAAGSTAYNLLHDPSYVTAVGRQRAIDLRDGSRIALNSNTRLTVAFRNSARRISLERGEAFFEVALDRERPFVVTAGDRKVTALGTAFIVRHESDSTAVTLMEGKVSVAPIAARDAADAGENSGAGDLSRAGLQTVILAPGERFIVSAKRVERIDKPAAKSVGAWRRGEVVLDHTPLAEAAAEMNRYDELAIVIDDPAIADIRISGNYRTGDAAGFARAVANMYALEADRRDGRIVLRKPPR